MDVLTSQDTDIHFSFLLKHAFINVPYKWMWLRVLKCAVTSSLSRKTLWEGFKAGQIRGYCFTGQELALRFLGDVVVRNYSGFLFMSVPFSLNFTNLPGFCLFQKHHSWIRLSWFGQERNQSLVPWERNLQLAAS